MVKILVKTEESVFQLCLFFGHSATLLDGDISGDTYQRYSDKLFILNYLLQVVLDFIFAELVNRSESQDS